ncbi:MAG: flagellar protein FlgN [Thermoanaerobacteraceae bacterium]
MSYTQAFFDVIKGEIEIYQDLLDLSYKKTDVIIAGEVKELDKITKVEGQLLNKILELEEKREFLLSEFGGSSLKDAKILDTFTENEKLSLQKLQSLFFDVLKKLQERNDLNTSLIKQSLEYINYSISLISDVLQEDNGIYGDKGGKKKYTNLIDKKV